MCDNLDPNRVRCDVCRTINLAKHVKQPKPDMQMYEKCSPVQKIACSRILELPLKPACIKVCTKEEYKISKTKPIVPRTPYYTHGKLMYMVKAGILVGTVYFTYTQGVWGDQQDVTECIRRWQEYVHSINTRRPPTFDQCGTADRVTAHIIVSKLPSPIDVYDVRYTANTLLFHRGTGSWVTNAGIQHKRKESTESILAPLYAIYKGVVTTCFAGVVKVPLLIKCAYVDYLKALAKKQEQEAKERQIRKRG